MNNDLVLFYRDRGTDHRGRTLADILYQQDEWWESTHDFIQWVFPLKDPSAFNSKAPLLDDETIELFRTDPTIQWNIDLARQRVEIFLGAYKVEPKPAWLTLYNHNMLRVTRILKFLMLVGYEKGAHELHSWLQALAQKYPRNIINGTLTFWRDAVDAYTGAPHVWRWVGWVDWKCDRCGCTYHGSDTWGCGRSQEELRNATPNERMMLYQYSSPMDYTERTCDEWVALKKVKHGD